MNEQFSGSINEFEQTIIDHVNRHGCHINWVFDENSAVPAFAYSIGFTKTVGAPEVVMFGLARETCGPAINALMAMCAAGQTLTEGTRIHQFFGPYDCVIRMVDPSWLIRDYFASAIWYHQTQSGEPLREVAMVVWPDAEHKFPWEEGCADWVRADQPPLYEPRIFQ